MPLNAQWAFKRTRLKLVGALVGTIRPLRACISCFTRAPWSVGVMRGGIDVGVWFAEITAVDKTKLPIRKCITVVLW